MTNIQISVINSSTVLTDIQVGAAVPDLQVQIHRDFEPVWGVDADLTFVPTGKQADSKTWWLVVLDDSDQAADLGYHDVTDTGLPIGKVFARNDRQNGTSWTVTMSHELLEMLADPEINLTVFVQNSNTAGRLYAYEVADACEDDKYSYRIGNTLVSDFVFPAWFESSALPGSQFDFQAQITQPLALLPGGYIGYFEVLTGNGWQQLTAERAIPGRSVDARMLARPNLGHRRERRRVPRDLWIYSTAQDLVRCPGGYRRRSHVHTNRGETVTFRKGPRKAGVPGEKIRSKARDPKRPPGPPAAQANWICSAWLQNTTGNPISSLTTTWQVPPAPTSPASQLIYLFNGIEPADASTILQPVLQWGDSGADSNGENLTGQFWTIACWIVPGPDGEAHHTPHVQVSPGDTLIGVISVAGQTASGFNYTCEFTNEAGAILASLSVANIPELVWSVMTLEAYEDDSNATAPYDLNSQSEYPAVQFTAFNNITIQTGLGNPGAGWFIADPVSQYGEHAKIVDDSATNGEIQIWYTVE